MDKMDGTIVDETMKTNYVTDHNYSSKKKS